MRASSGCEMWQPGPHIKLNPQVSLTQEAIEDVARRLRSLESPAMRTRRPWGGRSSDWGQSPTFESPGKLDLRGGILLVETDATKKRRRAYHLRREGRLERDMAGGYG